MAVRRILLWGEPSLETVARKVESFDAALADLITDLRDTCRAAAGAGLAAPQLGVAQRVVLVDLSAGADPAAELVLVNPEILKRRGHTFKEEGCLSFPGLFVRVRRPQQVWIRASDAAGRPRMVAADGLLARALCHEIDHLDGRLLSHRIDPVRRALLRARVIWRRRRGRWSSPVTAGAAASPSGPRCTAPPPAGPAPGRPGTSPSGPPPQP